MEKIELHTFKDWKDFQNTINKHVGWQKMTLYKAFIEHCNHKMVGDRMTISIDSPHRQWLDNTFIGLVVDGIYVGFANVYVSNDGKSLEIGNFEIVEPYTELGYGRIFFDKMVELFIGSTSVKTCRLTAYSDNARAFWRKLGFKDGKGDDKSLMINNLR